MKDIVIIANFCRDFSETDNGRFMYLCKLLSKENNVEIITNDFDHGKKKRKEPLKHDWPFTITFLHELGYRKNVSLQRFASHRAWGIEVKKYLKKRIKPDVVYCAVPSLTAPLEAAKYCEKNGIRFIIDIQDLWPEAFKLAFNIPGINRIVFFPFNQIANGIYRRADSICGVSKTYVERALKVNKKENKGHAVFLGTKLSTFDDNAKNNKIIKPEQETWIGYCGTLGASYDISIIIDALRIIYDRGIKTIRLIVMGDGERKIEFEERAKSLNVLCDFTGRLRYDQMCGLLSVCDIAVNPIMHNAAQSIINKHGDYAAAGLPVINTQESQEYRALVEEYHMGFNCSNNDVVDVADKILYLINNKEIRKKMGEGARHCAEERFDRFITYKELIDTVLGNTRETT